MGLSADLRAALRRQWVPAEVRFLAWDAAERLDEFTDEMAELKAEVEALRCDVIDQAEYICELEESA